MYSFHDLRQAGLREPMVRDVFLRIPLYALHRDETVIIIQMHPDSPGTGRGVLRRPSGGCPQGLCVPAANAPATLVWKRSPRHCV